MSLSVTECVRICFCFGFAFLFLVTNCIRLSLGGRLRPPVASSTVACHDWESVCTSVCVYVAVISHFHKQCPWHTCHMVHSKAKVFIDFDSGCRFCLPISQVISGYIWRSWFGSKWKLLFSLQETRMFLGTLPTLYYNLHVCRNKIILLNFLFQYLMIIERNEFVNPHLNKLQWSA